MQASRKTNTWLIILTIFCPIVGMPVIYCKRRYWFKVRWVKIALPLYAALWLLIGITGSHTPPTTTSNASVASKSQTRTTKKTTTTTQTPKTTTTPATTNTTTTPAPAPTATSSDPMAGITVAAAQSVSYDRAAYEPNWDVGSGCDIRSRLLVAASTVPVTYGSNGCTVKYGSWVDPYTGQTLTGNPYEGDGTANDLDIDHVIPLEYVNAHGGYEWSAAQKRAYGDSLTAMNNGVYLAVSAKENVEKGDMGPAEWYPPNPAYKCTYAKKWRDIAKLYNISLAQADYNLVKTTLVSCGIQ